MLPSTYASRLYPALRSPKLKHQLFPLRGELAKLLSQRCSQVRVSRCVSAAETNTPSCSSVWAIDASTRGISSSRNAHRSSICFCLIGFSRREALLVPRSVPPPSITMVAPVPTGAGTRLPGARGWVLLISILRHGMRSSV